MRRMRERATASPRRRGLAPRPTARGPVAAPLPRYRGQQPGVQIAQQRESGWLSSQLLQHGRANADRLTVRPNANAQQVRNSLARDILFMTHSCLRWRRPCARIRRRAARTPAAQAVRQRNRGSVRGTASPPRGRAIRLVAAGRARSWSTPLRRSGASPPHPQLAGGCANEGIGTARWRTCGASGAAAQTAARGRSRTVTAAPAR